MPSSFQTATLVALCLAPLLAAAAPGGAAASGPEAARKAKRPRVAVMEVKVLYGDAQAEALLSEVALTEAATFKSIDTIGRSDVQSLLGLERQRQLLGCTEDAACLAELGGALGVDYLLVGTVGRLGSLLRLDLKLVDGRKARVIGRVGTSLEARDERLIEATQSGVRALLRQLTPEEPPARPAGPSRLAAWITLGAGAAILGAGIASGLQASSGYGSLEAARGTPGYAALYDSRTAEIHRQALAADVLVPVGAATLAVGGWLWWRSRPAPPVQLQVTASPQRAVLLLTGEF
jgi:TolB-like protein